MTLYSWFVFFLAVQIIHFIGTWKLYQAAGRKSWEAAIPVYNSIVLMKIIKRPTWWTLLLFIPIINLIMFPVVWVETLRTFGKKSTLDTLLGIFTLGFYIYYVNYTQKLEYHKDRKLTPENKTADTISSLLRRSVGWFDCKHSRSWAAICVAFRHQRVCRDGDD